MINTSWCTLGCRATTLLCSVIQKFDAYFPPTGQYEQMNSFLRAIVSQAYVPLTIGLSKYR